MGELYVTATNNFFLRWRLDLLQPILVNNRCGSARTGVYFRAVTLRPRLCDRGFAWPERQERTPGNYNLRQNRWKM